MSDFHIFRIPHSNFRIPETCLDKVAPVLKFEKNRTLITPP